jgi:DNA-binding NarL/FixJ family response regulator
VVCLSVDPEGGAGLAASGPPAWALLGPGAGREQLAAAVRAVHRGLVVLGPPLAPGWLPYRAAGGSRDGPAGEAPRLTPREREVLALLAQGLGNKQIAWELSVSEHTVKYHVSALYAKLGASSRTEALRIGIERGLLSL